ncbi:hypothetical protein GCM10020367_71690 [Streptomyces sannanensis]|uniref:SpdD protein n=1 Tax=Streptomyces sannanensis TaxID=285536 RepID=A0ABP6SNS4_9ACTN
MPRKPVIPSNVYRPMAQHYPVDRYQAGACQYGHGHGQAPVQQIVIKQADPWVRYVAIGFAGAGIGLMLLAGLVVTLVAAGACAICVAVLVRSARWMFAKQSGPK